MACVAYTANADAARGDRDAKRVLRVQRVAPPRRHARRLRRRARPQIPDLPPGQTTLGPVFGHKLGIFWGQFSDYILAQF